MGDIGRLIDAQEFNLLPLMIKNRWKTEVMEAVAQSDNAYLVICRAEIDFERFGRLFRTYITELVKDQWTIRFRVYDADMSADFEVLVKQKVQV